jgi:hypothetical protein
MIACNIEYLAGARDPVAVAVRLDAITNERRSSARVCRACVRSVSASDAVTIVAMMRETNMMAAVVRAMIGLRSGAEQAKGGCARQRGAPVRSEHA